MRRDPFKIKRSSLLAQLTAPVQTVGPIAGITTEQALPPLVRIYKKRTFTAARIERQEALEQRLSKKARTGETKRRRLL